MSTLRKSQFASDEYSRGRQPPAGRDPGRPSRWHRLKFRHFAREAVTFFAAPWDKEAQEPARAVPLPFQSQRKRHLSFERTKGRSRGIRTGRGFEAGYWHQQGASRQGD
jgi:hypothetical protein